MKNLERVTGIEPAQPAWKAGALPLSYTREGYKILFIGNDKKAQGVIFDKRLYF